MAYIIEPRNEFRRQYRRLQFAGRPRVITKLKNIIRQLANGEVLPQSARNHKLSGIFAGYEECHVEPDWLLIYKIEKEKLILVLVATGTHDQLFN